jgi:hypothetical protein
LAPYELTLFSFLDSAGKEQDFTTTDPAAAQAHATKHGLVLVRNRYEFVTSELATDAAGKPPASQERQQRQDLRRQAERVPPAQRR